MMGNQFRNRVAGFGQGMNSGSLKCVLLLCIGSMLLLVPACGSDDKPSVALRHWVIDAHPNTGKDCCTDICILGDINGDGNLDVVIGGQEAEGCGLVWYENVSGTGKGEWNPHWVGHGYAHDVEVGDLDRDGDLDVVTCDKKRVIAWEQVNPSFFRRHVILERRGEGMALADIDGDGDLDIVYGGSWLENPDGFKGSAWESHVIAPNWHPDTRVFVIDMNKDGRRDVVLSVSEGKGPLSWFECPKNPKTEPWIEHPVEKETLEGAHTLQVADVDMDGDPDVVTAEMHTSKKKRILVYVNEKGSFKPVVLAKTGSHNMQTGDIDGDGDVDIVGKNYAGPGRVIEMWENLASDAKKWAYISIDDKRPESQKGKMGLRFADANRDGFTDVVAGSVLYLNPKGNLKESWQKVQLGDGMDVFFGADVDGDKFCDLIGIEGETVSWIEATSEKRASWTARPIGKVVKGRTQGYVSGKLVPGEKEQLIFTRGKNLYVLEIPANPEEGPWPLHLISKENEEEGLAVGDIDRDGDLDIAAVHADGHHAIWFENPGELTDKWTMHLVGESLQWMDRVALADLNGDGIPDFIATEETQDWDLNACLYWFEAPSDPKKGKWKRHTIGRYRSLNSMDIADVNGDGAIDIVVGEHTDMSRKGQGAADNLTVIYLNRDRGRTWQPQIVERGPHSSHLGARLVDLDNDGFPEIVSIGWKHYQHVHFWKRVAPRG